MVDKILMTRGSQEPNPIFLPGTMVQYLVIHSNFINHNYHNKNHLYTWIGHQQGQANHRTEVLKQGRAGRQVTSRSRAGASARWGSVLTGTLPCQCVLLCKCFLGRAGSLKWVLRKSIIWLLLSRREASIRKCIHQINDDFWKQTEEQA